MIASTSRQTASDLGPFGFFRFLRSILLAREDSIGSRRLVWSLLLAVLALIALALRARPWALTNWLPHPHDDFFNAVYLALDPLALYLSTGIVTLMAVVWPRYVPLAEWRTVRKLTLLTYAIALLVATVLFTQAAEELLKYGGARARPITRIEHTIIAAQLEGWLGADDAKNITPSSFRCPVGRIIFDRGFKAYLTTLPGPARDAAIIARLKQQGIPADDATGHVRDIRRRTGIGPVSPTFADELRTFNVVEPWRLQNRQPFLTRLYYRHLDPVLRSGAGSVVAKFLPDRPDQCTVSGAVPSGQVMRQGLLLLVFLLAAYYHNGIGHWPARWKFLLSAHVAALWFAIWSRIYSYQHTWSDEMTSFALVAGVLLVGFLARQVMFITERRAVQMFHDAGGAGFGALRYMVVVIDQSEQVLLWNSEAARVTGYDASEIRTLDEYARKLHPSESDNVLARKRKSLREGYPEGAILTYVTAKDGTKRLIHWSSLSLKSDDGTDFGKFSVGFEMNDLNNRLQDLGSGAISLLHELNHHVYTARKTHYFETALNRIDQLCDEFGKYATGKDVRKWVDVNSLLDGVLKDIYPDVLLYQVKLTRRVEPDLPMVFGSEYLLRHAVYDLIRNAIKAAGNRGRAAQVEIEASASKDGYADVLLIKIFDNGPGLPPTISTWIQSGASNISEGDKQLGLGLLLANVTAREYSGSLFQETGVEPWSNVIGIKLSGVSRQGITFDLVAAALVPDTSNVDVD